MSDEKLSAQAAQEEKRRPDLTAANRMRTERCADCYHWVRTDDNGGGACHRGPGPVSTTMLLPPELIPGRKRDDGPAIRTLSGWPWVHENDFCTEGFKPWEKH